MRYEKINSQLFTDNRKRFTQKLEPGCIAVFNSNDILPTNADGHFKLKQNADIFYLSGIDQEESILILFPDTQDAANREILFLKETNENIAIWEGHKLTKEEAR
ncbi:MAG: aminopeptidase P N-terminal domain-containing protein, partial [Bacteroidota bacterium]